VTLDRQSIYPIYLLNNGIEAIKIQTNKTKDKTKTTTTKSITLGKVQ
jgi:hypothetical protein